MNHQVDLAQGMAQHFPEAALEALRSSLRGEVFVAGDASYDSARAVWNAMIDRHPLVIVRCRGAADVMAVVNFARALPPRIDPRRRP